VSIDEHKHVALPKLYGQPAYARPARPVQETERPPDVDDLPIAAIQTDEEREAAAMLSGETYGQGRAEGTPADQVDGRGLRPRPFSLRSIGRLFGGG
jgi:hypothetical protein